MSTTDESSTSMDDEHLIVEATYHEQHANSSAAFVLLRRRRRQQLGWRHHISGSGSPTRFRRIFIRPLMVFLIGFCYLQRRSIVVRKNPSQQQQQQQQPELEEESSRWLKPSYSTSSSSNLEFHFGNETHEMDFASSSSHTIRSNNNNNNNPNLVSSASRMNQHAFHPPYFPRHVSSSSLHSSSADSAESDPETFGWEPSLYPNPRENPQKCGIAYLFQNEHFVQQSNDTTTTTSSTTTDNSLQLCDPDWVLGGIYLEEIAIAMKNFVATYSSQPPFEVSPPARKTRMLQQDKRGWEIVDEDYLKDTPPYLQQGTPPPIDPVNNESAGDENLASPDLLDSEKEDDSIGEASVPFVELAIATVRKMHISAVLEHGIYYSYEDEEDMVSDAAQIFARYLHDRWWQGNPNGAYGILIFLSIQDRVCFISTGSAITTVLPWWRLEHIVASMKPDLRHRDYGHALLTAIHDLSDMLAEGPPTLADRFHDFMARFGVVIAFAAFTFFFGAWGEFRDRRKRWEYADSRSKMSQVEREKARLLQREFKTRSCPICLENFNDGTDSQGNLYELSMEYEKEQEEYADSQDRSTGSRCCCTPKSDKKVSSEEKEAPNNSLLRRVDSYGIPLLGPDHRNVKMLRCGHIFCDSCWKEWVHSGQGNPCICPVCRQDVGKASKHRRRRRQQQLQAEEARREEQRLEEAANAASTAPPNTDTTPLMNNTSARSSGGTYDSLSSYRASSIIDGVDEENGHGGEGMFSELQYTLSEGGGRASLPSNSSHSMQPNPFQANARATNGGQEGEDGEGDQGETQSLLRNGPRRAQRNWFMR
ncbi:unnamed protein product [Cylindrotheca closterium]|uniref:RING-type domain-containing protein n=1 Tax=Cylindrotheca closterium TaxID=2856 RepID=A0AAD2PV38_9STRA|nr:unnamed protein product [Cylindrotheca closterium]